MKDRSRFYDTVDLDGPLLQSIRKQRRITQVDLSGRAGISRGYVSVIELNPQASVSRHVAEALAEALGVDVNDIRSPADTFGDLLKHARERIGMSQQTLAERAGISSTDLDRIERNEDTPPRLSIIRAMIAALQLTPHERERVLTMAGYSSQALDHTASLAVSGPTIETRSPWKGVSDAAFQRLDAALLSFPSGRRERCVLAFASVLESTLDDGE